MIRDETILVTGGAGFIGTTLCERLAPRNRVRVLDTFSRNTWEDTALREIPNVELIRGDVRDAEAVAEAARGAHRIAHLASVAGVSTVLENPALTISVAFMGTHNVLEAARRHGTARRVVAFSTSEVFGRFAYDVRERDPTPIGPVGEGRWTYAVSKIAAEHLANAYHRELSVPAVSLRPFNVYGPGQVGEGAVHHFVLRALADEPITVNNDGRQIRSWCYIDDMIDGTLRALEDDSAVGHAFNIGNPAATITVLRLAELIQRLSGSAAGIEFRRRDHPDVETRVPNIDKARDLLGYEPRVALEEGLERTIAWYRERRP